MYRVAACDKGEPGEVWHYNIHPLLWYNIEHALRWNEDYPFHHHWVESLVNPNIRIEVSEKALMEARQREEAAAAGQ